MKIFITNLPSFYKINLYNRINEKCPLLVVYTGLDGSDRNDDFFRGEMSFRYIMLRGCLFQKILQTIKVLYSNKYEELILSGWDTPINWVAAYLSKKRKNSIVVESSIKESKVEGIKGWIKKNFCQRISKGYVSGHPHAKLLEALDFRGEIVITKGVGIFNYIPQPAYVPRKEVTNFIFVGRLVPVKNIELLILVFNTCPDLHLDIVGFGVLENYLKGLACRNISFQGAIDNKQLPYIYQKSDVFILPSKSEPWGLVVEEALNNGLPVIISDRVGCGDDVVTSENGLKFMWNDPQSLLQAIRQMQDINFYNQLRANIAKMDFAQIAEDQVNCYIR